VAPGSAVVDRVRRWLLLDGRRSFVTAVLLLVLYVFLGPVGHYLVAFGGTGLSEAHTLSPLFTTQLSGVFLLVSIVVSINSLFVSIPVIGLLSFVLMHLNELPAVHALVVGAHTVGYAPFAPLAAYVVRVPTVSQRTGAAGQFVLDSSGTRPSLD